MPSKLFQGGDTLKDYIVAHPELLGDKVRNHFGDDLPFLFKVLAIRKALSIQAHPDKALAKRLHQERPNIYKDDNHKPEMAVAITEFSGFCGFLPVEKIAEYLSFVPELVQLIGSSVAEAFRDAVTQSQPTHETIKACLKDTFARLMNAKDADVQREVSALTERYQKGDVKGCEKGVKDLILELSRQYPGDVGIFCTFFLNVVKLQAGQAAFLKANEPHAYLYGDIMECMATSDNVVRAGLTPKLRDVPTLVSMLTYTWGPADSQIMPPTKFRATKATTLYDPPIQEFSVLLTKLEVGQDERHDAIDGPSILIVTEGTGRLSWKEKDGEERTISAETQGLVYFVGAGVPVDFVAGDSGLTFYRAFVEAP